MAELWQYLMVDLFLARSGHDTFYTLFLKNYILRPSCYSCRFAKKMEISQVRSFLDDHYKEKLSLESVAGHFFIDKHYLARLFKEQYGVTLVTYLQQVRITHEKRMLRFTDKSIEEIGLECGIEELNYFSRVFKKLEGVSPSEFRRMW